MKNTIFWDTTHCSPLKINRRFEGTYRHHLLDLSELCLPPDFTLVPCSAYSSTLRIEAICSPETSVDFQQTTKRYIPEDSTLSIYVFVVLILTRTSNNYGPLQVFPVLYIVHIRILISYVERHTI
jgi:hypothetical protein